MAKEGEDPLEHRKLDSVKPFKVLSAIAEDWLQKCDKRIKTASIYRRVYKKDISPIIGGIATEKLRHLDIKTVIQTISHSGRPSITNEALNFLKHIFRHGIKLGIVENNPADAFQDIDAGGIEKTKQRAISINEIGKLFNVLNVNDDQITRESHLAIAILISLAFRKMELMASTCSEFNLNKGGWIILFDRTKTGVSIKVPPHISERCLNHKIKGVEGVYNQYDYFDERKVALEKI